MSSYLRSCYFDTSAGRFVLTTWDTYRIDSKGNNLIRYVLTHKSDVLFLGEDYGIPSWDTMTSDVTMHGLMIFLTRRLGDTDPEFFAGYTPKQIAFRDTYAEELSHVVENRFSGHRR